LPEKILSNHGDVPTPVFVFDQTHLTKHAMWEDALSGCKIHLSGQNLTVQLLTVYFGGINL
jgi:hypothetical protein